MSKSDENEAIQAAMKADLGRERQEELPLNDRPTKGPSWQPRSGTGVNHINPQLRMALQSSWSVPIVDDESRQMEGLQLGDARPYAKNFMQQALRLKGGQQQASKNSVRVMPWPSAQGQIASLPGKAQHLGHAVGFAASNPQQKVALDAMSAEQLKRQMASLWLEKLDQTSKVSNTGDGLIFCRGRCALWIGAAPSNPIVVSFWLKSPNGGVDGALLDMRGMDNCTVLVKVSEMQTVRLEEIACIILCKPGTGKGQYRLQVDSQANIEYLHNGLKYIMNRQQSKTHSAAGSTPAHAAKHSRAAEGTTPLHLRVSTTITKATALPKQQEATIKKTEVKVDVAKKHTVPDKVEAETTFKQANVPADTAKEHATLSKAEAEVLSGKDVAERKKAEAERKAIEADQAKQREALCKAEAEAPRKKVEADVAQQLRAHGAAKVEVRAQAQEAADLFAQGQQASNTLVQTSASQAREATEEAVAQEPLVEVGCELTVWDVLKHAIECIKNFADEKGGITDAAFKEVVAGIVQGASEAGFTNPEFHKSLVQSVQTLYDAGMLASSTPRIPESMRGYEHKDPPIRYTAAEIERERTRGVDRSQEIEKSGIKTLLKRKPEKGPLCELLSWEDAEKVLRHATQSNKDWLLQHQRRDGGQSRALQSDMKTKSNPVQGAAVLASNENVNPLQTVQVPVLVSMEKATPASVQEVLAPKPMENKKTPAAGPAKPAKKTLKNSMWASSD